MSANRALPVAVVWQRVALRGLLSNRALPVAVA